jgi:hypothetical protein
MATPSNPDSTARMIPVLHQTVPLPELAFFQLVKVKTTKEIGTVVGMWCFQTENQDYQWLYRLDGLHTRSTLWWQGEQLRNLQRRRR